MPRPEPEQPENKKDSECLAAARGRGQRWKNFRSSPCGQKWWRHLSAAYDDRCVYCDHAPARTVDHVVPKSKSSRRGIYEWKNWRAACGDCNREKGSTGRPFDPVREDPFSGLRFDPDTGKPEVRDGEHVTRQVRARARESIKIGLDNQVLNDARRKVKQEFLEVLMHFLEGDLPESSVWDCLATGRPNRSVLRDFILERDAFEEGIIVTKSIDLIPDLETWAKKPLIHC